MQKTKKLLIEAIKSPLITPKDNLAIILEKLLKKQRLRDGDIIVIASKVVAITQNRVIKIKDEKHFDRIVQAEADEIVGHKHVTLTLKDNIFIAWAGIDRSNVQKGYAILWPKNPFQAAKELRTSLQKKFKIKKLGVLITDSCCTPLRKGVSGVALGYSGFQGVNDLRGHKDLYGNTLKVTQQAVADNLASAVHLIMGESDDQTPFALVRNAPVIFSNKKIDPHSLTMKKEECLFSPLYKNLQ